jgi:hypothetical protein
LCLVIALLESNDLGCYLRSGLCCSYEVLITIEDLWLFLLLFSRDVASAMYLEHFIVDVIMILEILIYFLYEKNLDVRIGCSRKKGTISQPRDTKSSTNPILTNNSLQIN